MKTTSVAWIFLVVATLLQSQSEAKLRLIQAVFRHGNRTPMKGSDQIYPNDPYKKFTYEPLGYGALTNTGKQTVYELGEFLRSRYGGFLGPIYSPEIIRFQADEVERVVMTGQLAAAALFPPVLSQRWNPKINWQPIPIWMEPLLEDVLFGGIACTNYKSMRQEVERTDKFLLKHQRDNQDFFDYLSQYTGGNVTQRVTFYLRQQLFAEKDIGLLLPPWTKSVFPKLEKLAAFDVAIQSYTNEMKQLMGGVWIKQWLKHVKNYLNETSTQKQKAFMYPAHEYNIGGILNAVNAFDYKIPYYAACIVFELHEERGEYFVQMLHRDKTNVRLLEIPGCNGTMCPLDDFIEITQSVIPENEKELCGELVFDV